MLAAVDTIGSVPPTTWLSAASAAAGAIVGLSLGLTGGGGAMTTRCFVLLTLVGLLVGLLSGLFGVGGGFLIVPALVAFATMDVFRVVGTSLFVITLVSASAVAAQVTAGRTIPLDVVGGFVTGSVPALFAGSWLGHRLGGPALARTFAVAIVIVAVFIITKTMLGG